MVYHILAIDSKVLFFEECQNTGQYEVIRRVMNTILDQLDNHLFEGVFPRLDREKGEEVGTLLLEQEVVVV